MPRPLLPLAILVTMLSCQGQVGELGSTVPLGADPCTSTVSVGSAPARRLSHLEYGYTLTDVFPADAGVAEVVAAQQAGFTADPASLGFKNSAAFLQVSGLLAQQYQDAAEAVSTRATANLRAWLPCAGQADEAGCADQLITGVGGRLYRRPLEAEEVAAYRQVYGAARDAGYDFATGAQWVLFGMLQSPGFLYRVELDAPGDPAVRPLRPAELAVRLASLLWQSAPDQALLDAAAAGRLSTPDELEAQARRMLADPKGARRRDFYDQWLGLDALATLQRDPAAYPGLDPALPALLTEEVHRFVDGVHAGPGTLEALYTSPVTHANRALAAHYGLPPVTGDGWQEVRYPGRRGGLFMLGGVLAQRDKSNRTSIVRRGLLLRTQLLCQVVPAPPPGVPALGPVDGSLSQAERLQAHQANPACSGCHQLMDGLGSPFEDLDAVGRLRTRDEGGHAVATTGALTGLTQQAFDGPVVDGLELVTRAAHSPEVAACYTLQVTRFALGRGEEPADACSSYQLQKRFLGSGGKLDEALVGLTRTDGFRYRKVTPP